MTENELRDRINNAIILLTDGHTFKFGDLTFGAKDENHFSVTGWTLCNDLKNLTKQRALDEMNETKSLFNKMTSVSPELTDFIKDRQVKYSLGYDYGMGGIEICNETNGQIKWTTELEK
jgi:ribulose bisphosphate carboxylase small subunit